MKYQMTCFGYPITITKATKTKLLAKLNQYQTAYPQVGHWTIGVDPATNQMTDTLFSQNSDTIVGHIPHQHQNSPELQRRLTTKQLVEYLTQT